MGSIRKTILVFVFLLAGCNGIPRESTAPAMPQGYKAFEFPREFNSLPLAGALVAISPNQGFRYLGHLVEDCGLDREKLRPVPGLVALPSFKLTENADVNLLAVLGKLISVDVASNNIKSVQVDLGPTRYENLVPIKVVRNAQERKSVLLKLCGDVLKSDNVFWISDTLKTESFKLTFKNEAGLKIGVSAQNLPKFVTKVGAGVDIKVGVDGSVEITSPVYVGFRAAYPSELLTGTIETFAVTRRKPKIMILGDDIYSLEK